MQSGGSETMVTLTKRRDGLLPFPLGWRFGVRTGLGLGVAAGVWGVRVHDVLATVDALAVWRASGRPRLIGADGA